MHLTWAKQPWSTEKSKIKICIPRPDTLFLSSKFPLSRFNYLLLLSIGDEIIEVREDMEVRLTKLQLLYILYLLLKKMLYLPLSGNNYLYSKLYAL